MMGAGVGGAGIIAALVSFSFDLPALALAAGLCALLAGVLAFRPDADPANSDGALDEELSAALQRVESLESALENERELHDATRASLNEHLAAQPPAGSFDRKLSDTERQHASTSDGVSPMQQTNTRLLSDPETNLFSEAYFRVALDARIASARRHLRPVAIAILEVVEGPGMPSAPRADPSKVTGAIRQTLRDADTACRMSDGCYAIILEDTPENGAVWTVERIRRNLTSRYGHHTMWAGVACYPAHAFSADEIMDQSSLALDAAREWNQDRIEVAVTE